MKVKVLVALSAMTSVLLLACSDSPITSAGSETSSATSESKADSVVTHPPADTAHSPKGADTTVAEAGTWTFAGRVVDVRDASRAWKYVSGVTITLIRVEAAKDTMVLGSAVSDASGKFSVQFTGVRRGWMALLITPPAGSEYGKSTVSGLESRGDFTYVPMLSANAPAPRTAPILAVGRVFAAGDSTKGVGNAVVEIWHDEALAVDTLSTPGGTGASAPVLKVRGVADANGFFILEIPTPTLYQARAFAPAGSAYADGAPSGKFLAIGYRERPQIIALNLALAVK